MEEEPQQYLILSDSVTQKKAQIKWNIRTHNDFEYHRKEWSEHANCTSNCYFKIILEKDGAYIFIDDHPWQSRSNKKTEWDIARYAAKTRNGI